MIALREITEVFGGRDYLIHGSTPGRCTFAEFAQRVEEAMETIKKTGKGPVVSFSPAWQLEAMARFLAHLLLGHSLVPESGVEEASLEPFLANQPLLVLKTAGTSGKARHVVHSTERLLSRYSLKSRPPSRQLILYAADHMAGLDAFLDALSKGATLVVPPDHLPTTIAECLEAHRVTVLPSTPSQLQFLLLSGVLENHDLSTVRTIPHGAEKMPESLRKRLQVIFPAARLLQRFGMTELGALPVREDLEDPSALFLEGANLAWKVEGGELCIKSPSRMLGYLEEGPLGLEADSWLRTGDLAELTPHGAVKILGRGETQINIGGQKVIPEIVEALLLEIAGVSDAEAYGIPSPLTGESLAASVVYNGKKTVSGLISEVRRTVRRAGHSLAWAPTRIDFVEAIPRSALGKRIRVRERLDQTPPAGA